MQTRQWFSSDEPQIGHQSTATHFELKDASCRVFSVLLWSWQGCFWIIIEKGPLWSKWYCYTISIFHLYVPTLVISQPTHKHHYIEIWQFHFHEKRSLSYSSVILAFWVIHRCSAWQLMHFGADESVKMHLEIMLTHDLTQIQPKMQFNYATVCVVQVQQYRSYHTAQLHWPLQFVKSGFKWVSNISNWNSCGKLIQVSNAQASRCQQTWRIQLGFLNVAQC